MSKLIFGLITLFADIILTGCYFKCLDKGIRPPEYSRTIGMSQSKGVFQFEMVPNKSNISLHNGFFLTINEAWVENGWCIKCLNGDWGVEKSGFYNLVIDASYDFNAEKYKYYLDESPLSIMHYVYNGQDTILLRLYKAELVNGEIGKKILIDSIMFIKQKITTKI